MLTEQEDVMTLPAQLMMPLFAMMLRRQQNNQSEEEETAPQQN